ncbi:MAG: hypothetical protein GX663_00065 [Clostridiales bacterium]|nr:hypothetical protein [Clostridiales bacterium]
MSLVIFVTGATGYSLIEYFFRGYTHWSMALTGGACLLTFYYFVRGNRKRSPFVKALAGACIFTVFEFCVGLVVNLWYGWNVWDYSMQPGNILGQVCPVFSIAWFVVCLIILFVANKVKLLLRILPDTDRM